MKKALFWIALFIACLTCDTVIFPRLLPLGFRPDLVIVVIVITAVFSDWIVAGIFGVVVGLVIDVLTGLYVGIESITYLAVAALVGLLAKKHFANNLVFAALAAFAGSWVKELLFAFMIRLFGGTASIDSALFMLLTAALITAAVTVPVYFVRMRTANLRTYRRRY